LNRDMRSVTSLIGVLAIVATAAIFWQRMSLSQLRNASERSVPGNGASQADVLTNITGSEQEAAALREETRVLPKLRNEIGQLRSRQADLVAARAENARLLELHRTGTVRVTPPGFTTKEQLSFAGYATPEATVQTLLWAIREGDYELAMQSCVPEHRERVHFESLSPTHREKAINSFKKREEQRTMKYFSDFAVAQREQLSDEAVVLHLRSSVSTNTMKYQLQRVDGEWKVLSF
jgi:hypothetical protein